MGTTEVQRTLVKSPPELWAELSDQDTLARHLSELGEIRIVSTVAESVVHWESDDATGCALIKQAGWGTKVTLRATVKEPESSTHEAPTPVLAAANASPPAAPHTSPPATPTPMTAAALRGSLESSPLSGQTGASAMPPSAPEATRPEPAVEERPPLDQPVPEQRAPEPAVADEPASSEPVAVAEPTTAQQPTPEQPDTGEHPDPAPEPLQRGFFARLFGRRALRHGAPEQPASGEARSPETDNRPRDADAPPIGADGSSGGSSSDDSHAPRDKAAEAEPIQPTALEALQARYAVRAPAPEPPPAPPAPPVRPAPPEVPALHENPDPPESPADLSSELRQAEEIGAEDVRAAPTEDQVKEILTGVLDRLGSAHHRPFSRA